MERWPEGFIVTGDAVCPFNPIYGQGMTVSAMDAELLDESFAAGGVSPSRASSSASRRIWLGSSPRPGWSPPRRTCVGGRVERGAAHANNQVHPPLHGSGPPQGKQGRRGRPRLHGRGEHGRAAPVPFPTQGLTVSPSRDTKAEASRLQGTPVGPGGVHPLARGHRLVTRSAHGPVRGPARARLTVATTGRRRRRPGRYALRSSRAVRRSQGSRDLRSRLLALLARLSRFCLVEQL